LGEWAVRLVGILYRADVAEKYLETLCFMLICLLFYAFLYFLRFSFLFGASRDFPCIAFSELLFCWREYLADHSVRTSSRMDSLLIAEVR